ncbi:hypothetical protein [Flavobacterium sp. SORGH_AS_0622]|uniref:hypothetical protein n=1 Tax=Flavobacterium sp. SORGH_AS_0622 TaxID=3041772 RepID=UPI00278B7377|nr:hypothetical protein [Flavobacterium sp. SORGH_AS_0622]MDQ1165922.1 hypothetical protein [Flavobacterium sp. SORGH_AS_0622]
MEYLNAFIAFIAIGLSAIAIYISTKDNKKQITVGKIEEAYEITILLHSSYPTLRHLYELLDNYYNPLQNTDPVHRNSYYKLFNEHKVKCEERNMYYSIYKQIFRLNVLAHSYLDKETKIQVLAYTELYESLLSFIFTLNRMSQQANFKEGYPTVKNMSKFVDNLESNFINIINLGSEYVSRREIRNYRMNEFKIKLGLKNIDEENI